MIGARDAAKASLGRDARTCGKSEAANGSGVNRRVDRTFGPAWALSASLEKIFAAKHLPSISHSGRCLTASTSTEQARLLCACPPKRLTRYPVESADESVLLLGQRPSSKLLAQPDAGFHNNGALPRSGRLIEATRPAKPKRGA
jgi:hypothetical protein